MLYRLSLLLPLILLCSIIGCGNTGDLYLPEDTTTAQDVEPQS